MKNKLIILMYLSLTACARIYKSDEFKICPNEPLKHEYSAKRPIYLSCDASNFIKNLPHDHRNAAVDYFKFALMSSNSYAINNYFIIPGYDYKEHYRDENSGFEADIYESNEEVVIVFRGSDDINDWEDTNKSIGIFGDIDVPAQYNNARNLAIKIKNNTSKEVKLTGHSLGGSLANHASWYTGLQSITFNASPRLWVEEDRLNSQAKWIEIIENGDPLHEFPFTFVGNCERDHMKDSGGSIKRYDQFDFVEDYAKSAIRLPYWNFKNNSWEYTGSIWSFLEDERDHNIYFLARGLLLVAFGEGNDFAKKVMKENGIKCDFS
jgi:hypothetical protein